MTALTVSAGTVIFRKEQGGLVYLLLHYPAGHWDLVKGKMEKGESPRQTVIREAREETGICDLRFVNGFQEVIRYDFTRGSRTIHKRVIFFLAESRTKKVTISHEHTGYVWLDFEGAVKKTTYDNARNTLSKAVAHLSETLGP